MLKTLRIWHVKLITLCAVEDFRIYSLLLYCLLEHLRGEGTADVMGRTVRPFGEHAEETRRVFFNFFYFFLSLKSEFEISFQL